MLETARSAGGGAVPNAGRAVVTGAAGFIGSHLCERLLADGWDVVGIDSFEDYYPRAYKDMNVRGFADHPRFTLREASLLELASPGSQSGRFLDADIRSADVVLHLAAQAGVRASWGTDFRIYTDNNILATQLLLEAAKSGAARRFVYASSSSVYGDTEVLPMREDALCRPFSPYGVSKLAAENLCRLYWRNFGVPTVSLRFFTVYGPRQRPDMGFHRFIRMLMEDRAIPVFGDGQQTRDFTFVSDIVEGIVGAIDAPAGEVLNLGGGSRVTLTETLAVLGEVAGVVPKLDVREPQAGDVRDTWASLEHSQATIGYAPNMTLREGLTAELEWLRTLSSTPGFPWDAGVEAV